MRHEIFEQDYTQISDPYAKEGITALKIVYPVLEQRGFSAMMQTYRGNVNESPGNVPGQRDIKIDGNAEIWQGQISDLEIIDVNPIGMLADPDVNAFVVATIINVLNEIKRGEQVHIIRTLSAWALSIATAENPLLYSINIEYFPRMWGGNIVREFLSPNARRFLWKV